MKAMLLVYSENFKEFEQRTNPVNNNMRPVTILDDCTEMYGHVGIVYERGFKGYVICITTTRETFYIGCSWEIVKLVEAAIAEPDINIYDKAKPVLEEYAKINLSGTTLAFCLYCIWFHIRGYPLSEFPNHVDMRDIRMEGKFLDSLVK